MDKEHIVLTEQDLHMLVEDAVKLYLVENGMDEGFFDRLRGGMGALGNVAGSAAKQSANKAANAVGGAMNKAGQAIGNAYNKAANAVGGAYNKAAEVGRNVRNTMRAGAMNAEVQAAIKKTNEALDELIRVASANPSILGKNGSATMNAIQQIRRNLGAAAGRSQGNVSAYKNSTMKSMGMN